MGALHARTSVYLRAGHWLRWRRTAYVQFDTREVACSPQASALLTLLCRKRNLSTFFSIFQRTGDYLVAITSVHNILFSQHSLGPCTASTAIHGIKERKGNQGCGKADERYSYLLGPENFSLNPQICHQQGTRFHTCGMAGK